MLDEKHLRIEKSACMNGLMRQVSALSAQWSKKALYKNQFIENHLLELIFLTGDDYNHLYKL